MSKDKEKGGKKTLYVKFLHGSEPKKITIPSECTVTFGPICPGTKGGNNGEGSIALRIYGGPKATSTQIACFVKVESFFEVGVVECVSKSTKRATKRQQYEEGGVKKDRNVSVEVSEWRDELAEEDTGTEDAFLALRREHKDDDL